MSEFLTVRLSRQADEPIRWLVWSGNQSEIIASGELSGREQLAELTAYARNRSVIALIDGRDLHLTQLAIPAGAARQLDKMLPFLLEDDIAQEVDSLNFTVMKKSGALANVAAVERSYLRNWLEAFKKVGIEIRKVVPDVLALPVSSAAITAVQVDSQWLFRKDSYQGVAVDQEWLELFLASDWCKSDEETLPVVSYTTPPQGADQRWQTAEPEMVMALLAKEAINSPVNLLTGAFKVQSSLLKNIRVWRRAAVAAVLFVAVLSGQKLLQVSQAEAQAGAYREESERIFRSLFPEKRKIPTTSYLKRQITDEEKRLSGGETSEGVLNWLQSVSDSLKKEKSMSLSSLRYDANRGEVRVEVTMTDFQAFEVVKAELAKSFVVTQGPLDREGEAVAGSFVLRRKQ